VTSELRACRLQLERARTRLGDPRRMVDLKRQTLDDLGGRAAELLRGHLQRRRALLRAQETRLLRAHPQRRIADQRAALAALERRLATAMTARLTPRRRALAGLEGKLQTLSPLAVLERGYSLTRRPDGHVVTGAQGLQPGDVLEVTFRDGEVTTAVQAPPRPRKDEP
jgi:exodeoxyribonuclease VII large subunit